MSPGESSVRSRVASMERELESLRAANRALESSNRELEGFAASASHDLRSPLRTIQGLADLLLEDFGEQLGDEASRYVRRMIVASERLERLIEGLLEMSHVSRWTLTSEEVDLARLCREVSRELVAAEPARVVELRAPEALVVSGDPTLLRVAMMNLLANAWKFTRSSQDAWVEIVESVEDDRRVVTIRDNGIGFEAYEAERVFDPFERLHAAREFEGSGVGLATVRRIVERHGGSIRAEGRPGVGAAFHLRLP